MGLINKTTFKFLNEQTGQFKRLLAPKTDFSNLKGLKYMPLQLTTDVVEKTIKFCDDTTAKKILEKLIQENKTQAEMVKELNISRPYLVKRMKDCGLYKPSKASCTPDIILSKEDLQPLVDSKKTLKEIAEELNVSVGKIRYYLNKYKMKTQDSEEFTALKKYFSATNRKDKAEALVDIDKLLEQIAKEQYQANRATTFEDCLQDVRLRFFELASKQEKGNSSISRSLFRELREIPPVQQTETKMVDLDLAVDKADDINILTKSFEDNDFMEFILKNPELTDREQYIVEACIKENKTMAEIAESLGLTPARIKDILKKAEEKIEKFSSFVSSEQYLQQKSITAYKYLKNYQNVYWGIPVKGSNNYVWKV